MTFHQWVQVGLGIALLIITGLLLAGPAVAKKSPPVGVVDLHVDLPYQVNFKGQPIERGKGRYVAQWLVGSGVEDVVLPLYIPRDASPSGPQMQHLEQSYAKTRQLLSALAPWEHRGCQPGQGVSAHYAFEGAEPVGWDLPSVRTWSKRLRLYGLVHSYDTSVASSSGAGFGKRGYGLSRRGKELVRRIHAFGGIVDVSHASDEAFADAYSQALAAGKPMVATHSNARALANHPRNLSDPQLRAIAKTGGVVGINFHSPFLLGGPGRAKLGDVVRHIRHVIRVAGIDHVALGSDFEGGITPPGALQDVRGFPRLAEALQQAGLSRLQVEQVFGLNARRVLCQTR